MISGREVKMKVAGKKVKCRTQRNYTFLQPLGTVQNFELFNFVFCDGQIYIYIYLQKVGRLINPLWPIHFSL